MAAITSTGIGSGLDVDSIVSKLMAVESQPLTRLTQKEAAAQAKISAYGNLNSALANFQTAVSALSTPTVFNAVSAKPTDATVLTATGTTNSVAGSYNVNVTQLAAAQTLSTAGQASTTTTIGTGAITTLSFQFGTITGGTLTNGTYSGATFTQDADRGTGTVTIDSSNNSLQGIRDAVNAANIGVVATIVSDGSSTPNHLVFTSTKTGASSSMKISVSGADPAPADSAIESLLAYDPAATQSLTQSSAALNTLLTVNGIAVSSATSEVTNAVQGVTMSVLKVGTTSLAVSRDTSGVTSAVTAFVKAYNDLNTTFKSLAGYNADTKVAGALIGDSTVRDIQAQVRKTMSQSLTGLSTTALSLPQIGIEFQKDGTLTMDSTKFSAALAKSTDDIAGLFSTFGKATDSLVTFASSTTATKAGNYAVNITQLATRGTLTSSNTLGVTSVVNDGSALSVTLDGTTAVVPLVAGNNYTQAQLASMLQSAINGNSAFSAAGSKVAVTVVSGQLQIVSDRYGSASKISVADSGGNGMTLFGTITSTDGTDVEGTIDGQTAGGSGQILSAALGTSAEGLKVTVAGGALGARGTVAFSQGYADRLSKLIDGIIGSDGVIKTYQTGLAANVKTIESSVTALNTRLATIEKNYRAQFTALDVAISNMQSTSSYLTQQLAAIAAQTS